MLPPLQLSFTAALRDSTSQRPDARHAAARRLGAATAAQVHQALGQLEPLASDPYGPVRHAAIEALGQLAAPGSLPLVLSRFDDPDTNARQAAVAAAASIGGPEAVAHVQRALCDPRPEMRFQAAVALVRLAPADAGAALQPVLGDPDPEVRASAAHALGELGEAERAEPLAALLEDPEPEPRRAAAFALAAVGDARGEAELRAALRHPALALDATEALGRAGAVTGCDDLAAIAERRLAPLLLRAAAAEALLRLGDMRGLAPLRQVLRAWRADGRDYAVRAVGELQLVALADELARLVDRPRGTDPQALARALSRLAAQSEPAARALQRLTDRADEAGSKARQALAHPPR